tara:strand:- start:2014 stop:2286 length:273 start_codon:yes stop_codon:yes gene_type:complete
MSSKRKATGSEANGKFPELPRTVERCERYLDRMALVLERAGDNASAFLPIVRRLERELAEAKAEQEILERMRKRRDKAKANSPSSSSPDE